MYVYAKRYRAPWCGRCLGSVRLAARLLSLSQATIHTAPDRSHPHAVQHRAHALADSTDKTDDGVAAELQRNRQDRVERLYNDIHNDVCLAIAT